MNGQIMVGMHPHAVIPNISTLSRVEAARLLGQVYRPRIAFDLEIIEPGKAPRIVPFTTLVVNVGLDDILDKYYKGSAYTAGFFVGLTDSTPTIAGADTMASHAGWVEVTAYSEAVRQTLTLGTVASQSVDNSASKASFSINAITTVGGAFITDTNTKGGATGLLVGVGAFADQALTNGSVINITATLTAAP